MKFLGKKEASKKLADFYTNQWEKVYMVLTEFPKIVNPDIWTHPDIEEDDRRGYKTYLEKGEAVKVVYHRKKFGRWHTKDTKQKSSTTMWRRLRATLFQDTELDLDIVSCYPSIILWILREKIKCKTKFNDFENYLKNRQQIFDECDIVYTENTTETKYDTLKKFVCLSIFGGDIANHSSHVDLEKSNLKPLTPFFEELNIIRNVIIKHNKYKPILTWKTKMYKEEMGLKRMCGADRGSAKDFNSWYSTLTCPDRKIFATILENEERQFVEDMMDKVRKLGSKPTSYNYDGFQVRKFGDNQREELLSVLETEWDDNRHKYIKWKIKDWAEPLDLSKIKSMDSFEVECFNSLRSYDLKRDYFNRFHFKVNDKNVLFYREAKDGSLEHWKKSNFADMYEDLRYMESNGEYETEQSFMQTWFKDSVKRIYLKCVFKPPPVVVNKCEYNSWKGFPIEQEPFNLCIPTKIYKHFKEVMANNNPKVYKYLLDYFAHIIQYPGKKTEVCLVFQGEEGTGKSAFLEKLCEEIVGHQHLIIPSHAKNVFGQFSNLKNTLICIYNEANGKDFIREADTFKNKITAKHSRLEHKGGAEEHFFDTTNYILTTNNLNSCLIQGGSRRYLAIQISNKYAKNSKYFDPLFEELDDTNMIRCFFEEMKNRDITGFHPQNDIPAQESTLHAHIVEANHDQRDKFLEWFIRYTEHDHDFQMSNRFDLPFTKEDDEMKGNWLTGQDISVKAYRKFCYDNNIPKTSQLSKSSMDLFLNNINTSHYIFDKKRTSKGMIYKFNYTNLKQYCVERFGEDEELDEEE